MQVKTSRSCPKHLFDTIPEMKLTFEAIPEMTSKDFGGPPTLPEQLSNILPPTVAQDGIFIDYNKYFEAALLLNKGTMLCFLLILKQHLEDVQVFLGGIDAWMMQPQFCIKFITESFAISAKEFLNAITPSSTASAGSICIYCNEHSDHVMYRGIGCSSVNGHSYIHPSPFLLSEYKINGDYTFSGTFDIAQDVQQDKLKKLLVFAS